MPWPVYLALKQLFPSGRRFPFFTIVSGLMVAVGVALMHVATSIMGGFGHEIRRMIVDTQGEIQVVAHGVIQQPAAVIATVEKVPGVFAATPSAHGVVMIEHAHIPAYPEIIGVDVNTVGKVFDLRRYIHGGSLDDLDDDSVILSSKLAESIGARLGSDVEIYTPLAIEKMKKNEVLLPKLAKVVGLFEIGHDQLDRSTVICTLRAMQDLYGLGESIHGVNVRVTPGADEFKVARAINDVLPSGMRAQTWFETNADFQSIIRFEKGMVFFLLAFIVVVAAAAIMSSLLITVVRKTREIGLLNALGAKPGEIATCFSIQGFVLGVVGVVAGMGFGQLVLHFRNDVVRVVAGATVGEDVFIQFYQFANLPSYTLSSDVVVIVLGTICLSTLAGLIPAWRASRLDAVEALRNE